MAQYKHVSRRYPHLDSIFTLFALVCIIFSFTSISYRILSLIDNINPNFEIPEKTYLLESSDLLPIKFKSDKFIAYDIKKRQQKIYNFHTETLFESGFAVISSKSNFMSKPLFGFINKEGEVTVKPQFQRVNTYSEGLASVCMGQNFFCDWGFIDETGKTVIQPIFYNAYQFREGLAPVNFEGKFGYINKKGIFVIKPQFKDAHPFSEGIAIVRIKRNKKTLYQLINKDGKVIATKDFEYISNFSEGRALFYKDDRYGYIDTKGKIVIKPEYPYARNFSEGLAAVKKLHRWGFIDRNGNKVVDFKYNSASMFSEGLANVGIPWLDKFGYIDKTGKFVLPPKYRQASTFINGLAVVQNSDRLNMVIDTRGKPVWIEKKKPFWFAAK